MVIFHSYVSLPEGNPKARISILAFSGDSQDLNPGFVPVPWSGLVNGSPKSGGKNP